MSRSSCGAVVGLALALGAPAAEGPPAGKVALSTVTNAEFEKALAARKGQVVLIDFWAEY
jgi:hypothetical protein